MAVENHWYVERARAVSVKWSAVVNKLVAALVLLLAFAAPAFAIEVEFASRPVRREILALYDSRREKVPAETRIHRLAEMPLNWLGLKVVYADVNGELPRGEALQRYRGLLTWFLEPLSDPLHYLAWLDEATATGLRYACLAAIAPPEPPGSEPAVERIFARLGLKPLDQFVNVTLNVKIGALKSDMVGFERPIDKVLPPFRVLEAIAATTDVYLSALVPDEARETAAVLVATAPAGGYVSDEFAIYYDAATDKARWTVNPFLFFKQAFGEERYPIPDVTTLDGRRMYFSHIDGDGWNNISEIEGYREAQVAAADVIRREAIEPYPDLPVSAALIAADTIPELGGMDQARESAHRLYALPQVEVASHTYTHPFIWSFYEKYDRAAELAIIDKAAKPSTSLMDRVRAVLYRVSGKPELSDVRERYVAGSADLPRGFLKEPFDLDKEVGGALKIAQDLAPQGKKAALYQWSGDTEAFEEAIRKTRQAGVRNMNGGDSRLDDEYPSVIYVPPISRPVGGERQIYAASSNENTYTNNWHGPYYGQFLLEESLKNTEQPRRLKPFNLYYHMYSGEKAASLAAIKYFLKMARSSRVIPVRASQYAEIADDFFSAEIAQVDASSWSVANRGALSTVRFDNADNIEIDYSKSSGVLGASRHQGSMYVALDPASEPALITIKSSSPDADGGGPPAAVLVESRWQVSDLKRQSCGFRVKARGFGPGDMVWTTPPGQAFTVTAERGGREIYTSLAAADGNGRLAVSFDFNALEAVDLGFACNDR